MLFSFNFFIFSVNKTLSVNELHFYRLKMLVENLEPLLMFLYFQTELSYKSNLLTNDLVKLLVLLVGIRWEVFVQVILGDSVHNVVGHASSYIY